MLTVSTWGEGCYSLDVKDYFLFRKLIFVLDISDIVI